jgi:hypothetical protein
MHAPPPPPSGPAPSQSQRRGSVLDTVVKPAASVARRASSIIEAIKPSDSLTIGIDVLGLETDQHGRRQSVESVAESQYEEEDLFELDIVGEGGDLGQMIAGHGLTSPVLRAEQDSLDWAAELLLLTHEPLRRDMLELQRAVQPMYFGNLPETWRVKAFFRFFTAFSALVTQFHAVEVSVHYDWLVAPTGQMEGEHRTELLSYHRAIELELLAISRYEKKILDEVRSSPEAQH